MTMTVSKRPTLAALSLGVLTVGASAGEPCAAEWSTRFVGAGVAGQATELFVYDDGAGAGPQLYVAGDFSAAGGVMTPNIARYDGAQWSALGAGLNGQVNALHPYDFGQGEHLVAVGMFSLLPGSSLAQWNGSAWVPGPPGMPGGWLASLGTFDGQLIMSGSFTFADSNYVTRWTGTQWTGVPPGFASVVWDHLNYDDGGGVEHVVTGIPFIQGVPGTVGIAKWDGTTWSAFGTGINGEGRAMVVFDDGEGPALYVGGGFTTAGGAQAPRVARWKGGAWSAVGAGFNNRVNALAVFDDGTGPALYAGGEFSTSGGVVVDKLARWRGGPGAAWEQVGGGVGSGDVHALAVFDDDGDGATPPALYVAGDFMTVGGVASQGIARWGRCAPCAGDIDGTGVVDGSDLAVVLGQWGASECAAPIPCPADLDGSGDVDGSDLAIVLGAWGPCP